MDSFDFVNGGTETLSSGEKVRIYRFTNSYRQRIIVEIFSYDHNVYAIKFYLKDHKGSRHRYSYTNPLNLILQNGGINGTKNIVLTLNTISRIAKIIIVNNPKASFGFIGATKKEIEREPKECEKNHDNTFSNTRRYKVYLAYCKRHFSPQQFTYMNSSSSSVIILKNIKQDLSESDINDYLNNNIIPSL